MDMPAKGERENAFGSLPFRDTFVSLLRTIPSRCAALAFLPHKSPNSPLKGQTGTYFHHPVSESFLVFALGLLRDSHPHSYHMIPAPDAEQAQEAQNGAEVP